MPCRILAGASGYSFKEWQGTFYPDKIAADAMLPFYAERLPTVEINNTFYRMPKVSVLQNWAAITPDDFQFAIKASRRITHLSRLKGDEAAESLAYLYNTLVGLGPKRGPVLFQLPPNLKKDLPRLVAFLERLPADHDGHLPFAVIRQHHLRRRLDGVAASHVVRRAGRGFWQDAADVMPAVPRQALADQRVVADPHGAGRALAGDGYQHRAVAPVMLSDDQLYRSNLRSTSHFFALYNFSFAALISCPAVKRKFGKVYQQAKARYNSNRHAATSRPGGSLQDASHTRMRGNHLSTWVCT